MAKRTNRHPIWAHMQERRLVDIFASLHNYLHHILHREGIPINTPALPKHPAHPNRVILTTMKTQIHRAWSFSKSATMMKLWNPPPKMLPTISTRFWSLPKQRP
jgi:hypothetical protein